MHHACVVLAEKVGNGIVLGGRTGPNNVSSLKPRKGGNRVCLTPEDLQKHRSVIESVIAQSFKAAAI